MDKYKVIDLFAGAGGLSLGFMQTQKYDIKVAFENNTNMQETYKQNHSGVDVKGDVCSADYDEIKNKYGKIDVVIGGPPCQGFSNANRQRNHAVNKNNMLVKQYIRAILELQPKAFVMENVSMLKSDVHRFYLDKKDKSLLTKYNIPIKETKLQLIDDKYVFAGILDIIKDPDKINSYMWPEAHYTELNVIYKSAKNSMKLTSTLKKHEKKLRSYVNAYNINDNKDRILIANRKAFNAIEKYFRGNIKDSKIAASIEPAIMFQRMLNKAKEIYDNDLIVERYDCNNGISAIIKSYAVFDYLKAILGTEPNNYQISADILCAANFGVPQKRKRFVVMGIKRNITDQVKLPEGSYVYGNYHTVHDAIADLESITPVVDIADDTGIEADIPSEISDLGGILRDSKIIRNHIITKTTDTAMERFKVLKQGQNFHALSESLKTNTYTDVSRTQNTIYLRLDYNEPSGTVVNVRKSMWIHPTLDRAISVREAARLQTFPDSFIFCGSKDKQYQQVGNAVPPIMAKEIAKKLASQLKK